MLELSLILLVLALGPVAVLWVTRTPGFIPRAVVVGRCVEVRTGRETLPYHKNGRRRGYRPVRVQIPVVQFELEGERRTGAAAIPDLTERIFPGDRVRVLVERADRGRVVLLSGPIGDGTRG